MHTLHDYESMSMLPQTGSQTPLIVEAFQGSRIVSWYKGITDQVQRMLDDQEASRNYDNADRLRAFLADWRANELTGAMSIDQLTPLRVAARQQASSKWQLRNYFSTLEGRMAEIIAAETEELPRGIDTNQNDPMSGGLSQGAPPMSPDFGPEKEAPGDLGADLGADLGQEGMPPEGETPEEDKQTKI